MLADSLRAMSHDGRITAVVGTLADKNVAGIVEPLSNLVDSWIAVPVEGSRAEPAASLAQIIAGCSMQPCLIADSIPDALEIADRRADQDDFHPQSFHGEYIGPNHPAVHDIPHNRHLQSL